MLGGHQHAIYREMHRRYGDAMLQPKEVFGADIVTLFHPEDIEMVMRREGPLPKGLGQALLPFAQFYRERAPNGLNLGRINGQQWKSLRQAMNKAMMSPKAAQSYLPHLNRVIPACSHHLAAHGDDFGEYVPLMTFEMISSVLLDHQPRIISGDAGDQPLHFHASLRRPLFTPSVHSVHTVSSTSQPSPRAASAPRGSRSASPTCRCEQQV